MQGYDNFIKALEDINNPIYYAVFSICLIYILIRLFYKQIFSPLKVSHQFEKDKLNQKTKELEFDNARILAAFSEIDHNPVIRFNTEGKILNFNSSAEKILNIHKEQAVFIKDFIPDFEMDINAIITQNDRKIIYRNLTGRYFQIEINGIRNLKMAQFRFIDLTERITLEDKIKESESRYRSLFFYLQDHLETEKHRIGIELHDSICQNLLLLKIEMEKTASKFLDTGEYQGMKHLLSTTIEEIREILLDLKPRNLEDFGLPTTVVALSENITKKLNIHGTVNIAGSPVKLENKIELYLYRVIQEILTNIIKHSQSTEYHIVLSYTEDSLKIIISDNGLGFSLNKKTTKGFGLLNVSERIKAVNGNMEIESYPGEGTTFFFTINYLND